MENNKNFTHIPKEKFAFVNEGERLTDTKFEDKPIGYFKDAWIRFRKSKASVVASVIILAIILYAFVAPLLITNHDSTFMVNMYAKKPGRIAALTNFEFFDGGTNRDFSEKGLVRTAGIGVGAVNWDGTPASFADSFDSEYQP
ncbi:MAG: hypothetical protein IIV68_01155, partial [Alistipes sp.]|nr:hypothetical protein [Alistipes sp.]